MAVCRKTQAHAIARIETSGFSGVCPPYGGTVDHLPASFWAKFEESLMGPSAEDGLDAGEWSLMQAARDLGYHAGHEIISSAGWVGFIAPLDSDEANSTDVLHATFATLSGLRLDDCEIVELAPFERLVVRVYGYCGLLIPGPGHNRRTASVVAQGICSAVMDLAYGGPYDAFGGFGVGTYTSCQRRSVDRGDLHDEFVATRATKQN